MRRLLWKLALVKSQLVVLESEIALLRSNLMSFEMQMYLEKLRKRPWRAPLCEELRRRPGAPEPGPGVTT